MLNEAKRDLIENSSAIRIHDELKYISTDAQPLRVRLVPGSVKLYEISVNSDGSYTLSVSYDILDENDEVEKQAVYNVKYIKENGRWVFENFRVVKQH